MPSTFTQTHPSPLHQLPPTLLLNLHEMAVMRVSSRARSALANVEETGRRVLSHVASVQFLDTLPDELLDDSPQGEALREKYGVVPLLRRDVSPYADQPGAPMGYLVPAPPNGLVVFIHDSAAEANIFVPGDPLPRVAFAEFLVNTFAAHPTLKDCFFAAWARWIRDGSPAQRIIGGSQLFSVTLWNANKPVDVVSTGGSLMTKVEGSFASDERKAIRKRTTVGVLNALVPGKRKPTSAWPYAYKLLPLGYDLARSESGAFITIGGDGNTKWRPITLAPPAEIEALREMLRMIAAGLPWADCGEPLVAASIRCRGTKHPQNSTYDQLSRHKLGQAVRNLVTEANMRLWETGRYDRNKQVPIPTDGTMDGFPVVPQHGTYGTVTLREDFGLPDEGFLGPETATAIRARLASRGSKEGEARDRVTLFGYLPSFQDGDDAEFTWQRRIARHGDNYVLRHRDRAASLDLHGRPRGWQTTEGNIEITVSRRELERQVAQSLITALHDVVSANLAPLRLQQRRPNDPARALEEQIAQLSLEVEQLLVEGASFDSLAATCNAPGPDHDSSAAIRHSKRASACFTDAQSKQEATDRLRAKLTEASNAEDQRASMDLCLPAALAAMMLEYAGELAPIELNQTLRRHGLGSLRLDRDPSNARRAAWSVTFTFPLLDGTQAELPLQGTLRNNHQDPDKDTFGDVGDAVAEDFLRHAVPIDELSQHYRLTRARTVRMLRSWLNGHGVTGRGLRSAIVDMPADLTETRLALWSALTGDIPSGNHVKNLRSYLGTVYLGDQKHPNSWVARDCGLHRRVLRVMVDALPGSGVDGVDVGVLARAAQATETEINQLCGEPKRHSERSATFIGVLVRDPLNRRIVRLRACPHPDCTAAPGYAWLTHYLPVPETNAYAGLACPTCLRLPDPRLAHLPLPSAYLDTPWEGPDAPGSHDLRLSAGTTIGDQNNYRPGSRLPRTGRSYNITEAATHLGISNYGLRSWILDKEDPLPSTRMKSTGGSRYMVTKETLDAALHSERLQAIRRDSPRSPEPNLERLLTLAQVSAAVGVAEHYLRKRIDQGLLTPVDRRNLGRGGVASMLFSPDVLNQRPHDQGGPTPLPAEWVTRHQSHLLTVGRASDRVHRTTKEIKAAMNGGELEFHLTDWSTRLIDPQELDRWDEDILTNGAVLTPKAAAARAGVSPETLRTAAQRGFLPYLLTPGGHRRYRARDLDHWSGRERVTSLSRC